MIDSQAAAGVREGDILAGKYRVDRVLGIGGMGVVVAAHHVDLDDRVAIKFLLPEALHNGEAVARFAREAQAAVKIKSEHVARVTDVGRLENGAPYIVMEYLEGLDLSAWLQQRGRLPVDQAVEFVLQACEAIAEAHSLGIVHRDLKPANLFVIRRPDGGLSVKVLDFGIAKRTNAAGAAAAITSTAAVMGSPLYMSPEQLNSSKDADARTDVWALGVILHELLSGESPFLAETMPGVMMKITASEPPPLRARRPEVPAALERVILTCLEKDRVKRFPTIGDLAHALVDFGTPRARISVERIAGLMAASGIALSASGVQPPPSTVPANTAGTMASWDQTANSNKRGRGTLYGGLAAAAVLVIGVAGFALRHAGRAKDDALPAAVVAEPVVASQPVASVAEPRTPHVVPSAAVVASAATVAPAASPAEVKAPPVAPLATASAAARSSAAPRSGTARAPAGKSGGKAPSTGKVDVYDDRK